METIKLIAQILGMVFVAIVGLVTVAYFMWPTCPDCHERAVPSTLLTVCFAAPPPGASKDYGKLPFLVCPKCIRGLSPW